jgi:hypothetical protein
LVLRTYASVFPHVSVWFTLRGDLLLLGFDRSTRALDVDALEERFGQPDFSAAFARVEIDSFVQLIAHELLPLGTLQAVEREGPVHTLRHPILSHLAARAFFPGRRSPLPLYVGEEHRNVSLRNSLLRRYGGGGDPYPEEILEAGARESCRFARVEECVTFFARWAYDHPQSPRRQTVLAEARKSLGARQSNLAPNKIDGLQVFFGGKSKASALSLAQARSLTDRFAKYYHHAIPFDGDAIKAIWDRCHDLRCGTARRKAEGMLEDGSWTFSKAEQRGAKVPTGNVTRSLEPSPETPEFSPESEFSPEPDFSPSADESR